MTCIYKPGTLIYNVIEKLKERKLYLSDFKNNVYWLACAGLNEEPIDGMDAISVLKELGKTFDPLHATDYTCAMFKCIASNESATSIDIVDHLIKYEGYDIHFKNEKDATAMVVAIHNGRLDMVEKLISLGADVSIKFGSRNMVEYSMYGTAVFVHNKQSDAITRALLKAGAPLPENTTSDPFKLYIEDLRTEIVQLNKKYDDEFAPGGMGAKRAGEHFESAAKRQKNAQS